MLNFFDRLSRILVQPEMLMQPTTNPNEYLSLFTYLVTGDYGFQVRPYFALELMNGHPCVRFDFYNSDDAQAFVTCLTKHQIRYRRWNMSTYVRIVDLEPRGMMPPFTCVPNREY